MLRLLSRSHTYGRSISHNQGHGHLGRGLLVQQDVVLEHRDRAQKYWASSRSVAPPITRHVQRESSTQDVDEKHQSQLPIRQYLRSRLKQLDLKSPQAMPPDSFIYGSVTNDLTRTQSTGSSELDQLRSTRGGMTDDPEGDENDGDAEVAIVGVGSRQPGDLVELRATGSRVPVFAIYLGFFGDRNHFYAANGRWITSRGFSSLFTVTGFATREELAPLMAKIPRNASPEEYDQLRSEDQGPSRADASTLIERMHYFRYDAETVYQANIVKLDAARTELSDEEDARHLTLHQIAEELFPESLRKDGMFPAYALYAVHTALLRSEMGFRPLNPSSDCHQPDNLIEIFSRKDAAIIEKVATMVRHYTDTKTEDLEAPNPDQLRKTVLDRFVLEARNAVSASRDVRQWTPHGILKPSSGVCLPRTKWSVPSEEIIHFLEWWASHDVFEPGSRFHNYGSLILRALDIYDEDVFFDQSTAWTFLQEIGVIQPWEMPSRYKVRFPGVTFKKGGGLERKAVHSIEESRRPDIASGFRRKHDEATIFCIDAPTTIVIDDGISLERTEKPDEFWIHVHAADPASSIEPKSGLYEFMERIPENIYLPGHFQAMLPSELGEDEFNDESKDLESNKSLIKQFSLKSGSVALTFSAKVNAAGDILDYKVEPSTLGSVVYIDPEDVSRFCKEPAPPPASTQSLTVGSLQDVMAPPAPNRAMIASENLDTSSKEDLLTLYQLAGAIRQKRLAKGAWPYFFPRPSVSVSFAEDKSSDANEDMLVVPADPYISVKYETSMGCSVVSNLMVLAGEIAARWCSSRDIPIPYRRDIRHAESRQKAHKYATQEIYPLIGRGIEPNLNQRQQLARMTGGIEISSDPGSYFLLGLDMYAKATSPLRRFSDLLVHWQIHAALKHEREIKSMINPEIDDLDVILPFSKAELSDTLSLLQMREKMARTMSRGVVDWILMALVRAWRFEDSAPSTLRFTVGSRFKQGFLGRVDLFGLSAAMDVERLDGRALMKDVRVGDRFEVELADVNVHSRQILVKALRYLGGPEQE